MDGHVTTVTLKDSENVPTMRTNLVSVPNTQREGFECLLFPYTDKIVAMRGAPILMEVSSKGHDILQLMAVKVTKKNFAQVTTVNQKRSMSPLHISLTHFDVHTIKKMLMHSVVDGIQESGK